MKEVARAQVGLLCSSSNML